MTGFILAIIVVCGFLLGSIINYLVDVLPETRRFSPSVCRECGEIRPLVDFLLLRRCKKCGGKRSLRSWVVIFLMPALLVLLVLRPPQTVGFWAGLVLLVYFAVVALIDIETRLIMHPISAVGALLAAGIGLVRHGILSTILGGFAGFAIMLSLYLLGFLFARWIGKMRKQEISEEALGFGDVTLAGVLGLLLGWPGIAAGLFLAVMLGGAGSLIVLLISLIARKYHAYMAIPYGPFLILGAILLLYR